jgi:hypothetical protein
VGSIEKRLSRLEEQEPDWGYQEELDKALAQLSTADLRLLSEYLNRGGEEYAEPTAEEAPAIHRLEERLWEVANGH